MTDPHINSKTPQERFDSQRQQLAALQAVLDTVEVGGPIIQAFVAKLRAIFKTPIGQGIDLNKAGAMENSWDDAAFIGWTPDANGIYIQPAEPVTITPVVSGLVPGPPFERGGKTFQVRDTPFGAMEYCIRQ